MEPGKLLALVGLSGSGKSTLVAMLERLYDPDDGEVSNGFHAVCSKAVAFHQELLALVGLGGSGESTLVAILERLYDPDEGPGESILNVFPLKC